MRKIVRCAGYVLAGIGVAMLGTAGVFLVVGALFWLCDFSVRLFGLPDKYGMLFYVGYVCLLAGGFIGAVMCRGAAVSSTESKSP